MRTLVWCIRVTQHYIIIIIIILIAITLNNLTIHVSNRTSELAIFLFLGSAIRSFNIFLGNTNILYNYYI